MRVTNKERMIVAKGFKLQVCSSSLSAKFIVKNFTTLCWILLCSLIKEQPDGLLKTAVMWRGWNDTGLGADYLLSA